MTFKSAKILPVSVSKIQYNFYQNLKKKIQYMSENLKSIFYKCLQNLFLFLIMLFFAV